MKAYYETPQMTIASVAQHHDGTLHIIKHYTVDTDVIKKEEIYKAVDGVIKLISVLDIKED